MAINIALIGNPNSGITTLFNQMTGGVLHKGSFSTPNHRTKEGPVKAHKNVSVIEMAGMYSLTAYSKDELFTRDLLLSKGPDVIVNIIDATNFQRGLYLTLQLMELEIPVVMALNMIDEANNNDIEFDLQKIEETLGIEVIPISASKNQGIHDLIHYAIRSATEEKLPNKIDFCGGYVHTALHSIYHLIEDDALKAQLPCRFCCTKIMEGDEPIFEKIKIAEPERDIINHILEDMEGHMGMDKEASMADMRYKYIESFAKSVVNKHSETTKEHHRSIAIDKILTNKYLAIPIFALIMILVFYFTFSSIGEYLCQIFANGIDGAIEAIGNTMKKANVSPALQSLVINGICAGVGSVLSFLPRIAVLFFFLSILEDSGYMPRVAFVMDKLLRKLGLSGRSIVPMLVGFGCSVPAIMATRSLPSRRDRNLTITLIPFMSCSAKLPVYAMLVDGFFAQNKALIMAAIYFSGIIVAIIVSLIFKHTIYKGDPVPFVLVLPPYRVPAIKSVCLRMWSNVKDFIRKAFTIVLLATIVIWFLQSFDSGLNMVSDPENSLLASIGKFAAPIFAPLGFGDWRAATALLTGLSAKEAVVSTMAVLAGGTSTIQLSTMLSAVFTPITAFGFLLFCLLYMPCVATLATIKREMGGWRYALSVVCFQTGVAWLVAFLFVNISNLIL
ncbi:MAG: ferrous iron transport protein B [Anaerovoracaceae bacterium]